MKLLFFGTSHLGALQAGYSELKNKIKNVDIDFYGVSAPVLTAALYKNAANIRNNKLFLSEDFRCFVRLESGGSKSSQSKTFTGMELSKGATIDVGQYDAIVLVDLFFRFKRIAGVTQNGGFFTYKSTPVSSEAFKYFMAKGLGGFELKGHSKYGDIPFQESRKIINLFTSLSDSVYLLPAPYPPMENLRNAIRRNGTDQIKFEFDMGKQLIREKLESMDVVMLEQEESTMDSNIATKDCFSRGRHDKVKKRLDNHMNQEFGYSQLVKILSYLNCV